MSMALAPSVPVIRKDGGLGIGSSGFRVWGFGVKGSKF